MQSGDGFLSDDRCVALAGLGYFDNQCSDSSLDARRSPSEKVNSRAAASYALIIAAIRSGPNPEFSSRRWMEMNSLLARLDRQNRDHPVADTSQSPSSICARARRTGFERPREPLRGNLVALMQYLGAVLLQEKVDRRLGRVGVAVPFVIIPDDYAAFLSAMQEQTARFTIAAT
jgi:hypothetical protein